MEKEIQQITKNYIRPTEQVITGIFYKTGNPISLIIENGIITSIVKERKITNPKQIIAPGFVDIQINGYMGYDFNQTGMDKKAWENVIEKLLTVGVTTFYPTVITNSYAKLNSIFKEYSTILKNNPVIGGFHLEGPYISSQDGPRGAHQKSHIRPPDWDEFCRLQDAASGMIKIITISPEYPGTTSFIRRAVSAGVKVSIGHTAATSEQITKAVEAGASFSTHLGNGSHSLLPRHRNYVWDQLGEDRLCATIIADGHHLPNNLLKVFERTKRRKLVIVSDSVMLAGLPPGDYQTEIGGEVTLTDFGLLHLKGDSKILAGSAQHILHGINYLIEQKICNVSEAIDKASVLPSFVMGLAQKEGIIVGAVADVVIMEKLEKGFEVVETYKKGIQVYSRTR